jgi:zinc/manganese transport system substrate-binding protein
MQESSADRRRTRRRIAARPAARALRGACGAAAVLAAAAGLAALAPGASSWSPVRTARAASPALNVVTTTEGLAALARAVGGTRVAVSPLSRGYSDPHFVDAKPTLALLLARANLLVHVGLELESGWLPPLMLASRNASISVGATGNLEAASLVAVGDIPTLPAAELRKMGDLHPRGNPHFLSSPVEARKVVQGIAARLGVLDPAGAATYNANLAAFLGVLDAKEKTWRAALAAVAGRTVVAYHQSWNYFVRWAGLSLVGYIEPRPGIPPSPSHLAALVAAMKTAGTHAIVMENWYPTKVPEVVAARSGAKLLVLPGDVGGEPPLADYPAFIDRLVSAIVGALR